MKQSAHRSRSACLSIVLLLGGWFGCASSRNAADSGRGSSPQTNSTEISFGIAEERLLRHIALLAHDELKGRDTGSDGIDLAAGYIAGQFAAAELVPAGPGGTYFQEFEVSGRATLLEDTSLTIDATGAGRDAPTVAVLREDYLPFSFSAKGSFDVDLVFVGYGVTNPEHDHDDYADIDVRGKAALMFRREPPGWNPGGGFTSHAGFETKVALAEKHGASAVVIVNQDPGVDGVDGLMRFSRGDQSHGLPALHVKRALAEDWLTVAGAPSLKELQTDLDEKKGSRSRPLTGVRLRGAVNYEVEKLIARNVLGLLPGVGPRRNDYVVIGGHYDHLGVDDGEIHNGADDNASGTAAVIEAAHALRAVPDRDRSVLFMAFSAEEIGLLGSKHFVNHPTVPAESITAMINLDMIGRLNKEDEANMLSIQGLGTGDRFKDIITERTGAVGMQYVPDDSARGPSDHASFESIGVPSLFFFTGIHDDYHAPGDDTEKVNVRGVAEISELVCRIALDLINSDEKVQFVKVNQRARIRRGRESRVVIGILPGNREEGESQGWPVAQVLPGGGAAKAGMKSGDRIVQIDGQSIDGLSDYQRAVRGKRPGEVISVSVLRDNQPVTLSVELASPAAP